MRQVRLPLHVAPRAIPFIQIFTCISIFSSLNCLPPHLQCLQDAICTAQGDIPRNAFTEIILTKWLVSLFSNADPQSISHQSDGNAVFWISSFAPQYFVLQSSMRSAQNSEDVVSNTWRPWQGRLPCIRLPRIDLEHRRVPQPRVHGRTDAKTPSKHRTLLLDEHAHSRSSHMMPKNPRIPKKLNTSHAHTSPWTDVSRKCKIYVSKTRSATPKLRVQEGDTAGCTASVSPCNSISWLIRGLKETLLFLASSNFLHPACKGWFLLREGTLGRDQDIRVLLSSAKGGGHIEEGKGKKKEHQDIFCNVSNTAPSSIYHVLFEIIHRQSPPNPRTPRTHPLPQYPTRPPLDPNNQRLLPPPHPNLISHPQPQESTMLLARHNHNPPNSSLQTPSQPLRNNPHHPTGRIRRKGHRLPTTIEVELQALLF